MEKIKLGIIGPGKIAPRIIAGAKLSSQVELYAIGGRDIERAHKMAVEYQIPYHGLIKDIINSSKIQAVYIATPNDSHYELIKECLQNNKHVICEKPMVVNAQQIEELYQLAYNNGLVLMEAMKALFLPLTAKIMKIIKNGEIGDLVYMDGKYSYNGEFKEGDWPLDKTSGGGLRDVGVYPIGYFNYLANAKIDKVSTVSLMGESGCDALSQSTIRYANNVLATCTGGLILDTVNKAYIYGTKGYIEVEKFWKANQAILHKGKYVSTIKAEMKSDFFYEIDHFMTLINTHQKGSPIMSAQAALEIMKVYDSKEK